MGVNKEIVDALPVALRPFSSAGSRGFLIDSMNTFGADSLTGRLSSFFSVALRVLYVIAVYFGSVNIKTPVTL
jgi:spore maturation protein SpmB